MPPPPSHPHKLQALRMDPASKEWRDITGATGALRIVRGDAAARLTFSVPVDGKRRESLTVNARVDAATKPTLLPSVGGKPASLKINLLVAGKDGAKLTSFIFKVKTDAQAQAVIDSITRVTASLGTAASSAPAPST